MRAPRPQHRMPQGGRQLYELVKMDHEPEQICVFRAGDVDAQRARMPDTLVWDREFDPMVYFWSVQRQAALAFFLDDYEPGQAERLAKACLRDGARQVTAVRRVPTPAAWLKEPWGAPPYRYATKTWEPEEEKDAPGETVSIEVPDGNAAGGEGALLHHLRPDGLGEDIPRDGDHPGGGGGGDERHADGPPG